MRPGFGLEGRTALVTGATGLLGREHCRALRDAGARVVVADVKEEVCRVFAETLGGGAFGCAFDVTDKDSVTSARDRVLAEAGGIDILVNNAAVNDQFERPELAGELSKLENYPLAQWRRMIDVNVTGAFLCAQVFGEVMARAGRGSIINIASTYGIVAPNQSLYRDEAGRQSFYKSPAYSVSKGAVLSLTTFLASYWGERGVRVNSLSPGGVENRQEEFFVKNYAERTPLKRMARPDDYHGAIVFLASDAAAYVTGANLVVDGGFTIW
jgi:NAD(P)-dependent dehydrogenase (short-subunit alcohol dehydrogenase family)